MADQNKRKRLGEILVDMGIITQDQVEAALKIQKQEGGLLGAVLIKMKFVTESDIAIALAKQNSIPYIPVNVCEINKTILKLVDASYALAKRCIPLDRIAKVLLVVCADPTQQYIVTDIEEKTGLRVQLLIGVEGEIIQAIRKWYGIKDDNVFLSGEAEKKK